MTKITQKVVALMVMVVSIGAFAEADQDCIRLAEFGQNRIMKCGDEYELVEYNIKTTNSGGYGPYFHYVPGRTISLVETEHPKSIESCDVIGLKTDRFETKTHYHALPSESAVIVQRCFLGEEEREHDLTGIIFKLTDISKITDDMPEVDQVSVVSSVKYLR